MSPSPRHRYSYLDLGLALLLLVNFSLLLYYLVFDFQYLLHADASIRNLLAQEIHDTGKYFPPSWNYVNGDLWVLYTHSFIVPLLYFFPNGYPLFAVSSILSAILVLTGSWLAGAILGQSRRARVAGLLVLSSGISLFMAESVFGQAAYGSMYYMACFLLYFSWRYLHPGAGARWGWGAAAALVAMLVFWANPQRGAVMYALPLMAAAGLWRLAERQAAPRGEPGRSRPLLVLALMLTLAALAGAALHALVLEGVNHTVGLSAPRWLRFSGMTSNAAGMIEGLISLLGGMPQHGQPVASGLGAYQALRLLVALALLGLLPWALFRILDGRHRGQLFFGVFTLVSAGLGIFIFTTTTVPDMAAVDSSIRYLVPSVLFMLLALVGVLVDGQDLRPAVRVSGLVTLAVLASSSLVALRTPDSPGLVASIALEQHNPRQRLARFLEAQGLHYGYAGFWHSGAVNILSAQRVRIRQISWEQGLPVPMRHLSSDRWYRPEAWVGPTFLMLRSGEADAVNWNAMTAALGEPARILEFEGYRIFVYAENIARRLPAWMVVAAVQPIPIGAASNHRVGRFQAAPAALVAEPGEAGALHFGPYLPLKRGKYTVSFSLDASAAGVREFGVVDVAAMAGKAVLAVRPIGPGLQRITVPFALERAEDGVELRVMTNGAGRVALSAIELAREE